MHDAEYICQKAGRVNIGNKIDASRGTWLFRLRARSRSIRASDSPHRCRHHHPRKPSPSSKSIVLHSFFHTHQCVLITAWSLFPLVFSQEKRYSVVAIDNDSVSSTFNLFFTWVAILPQPSFHFRYSYSIACPPSDCLLKSVISKLIPNLLMIVTSLSDTIEHNVDGKSRATKTTVCNCNINAKKRLTFHLCLIFSFR